MGFLLGEDKSLLLDWKERNETIFMQDWISVVVRQAQLSVWKLGESVSFKWKELNGVENRAGV